MGIGGRDMAKKTKRSEEDFYRDRDGAPVMIIVERPRPIEACPSCGRLVFAGTKCDKCQKVVR